MTTDGKPKLISRRNFLRVLGVGAGALALGVVLGRKEAQLAMNQAFLSGGAPTGGMPESPFVWIKIDSDNITHLHLPKSEMGQGIHTTLAQIAAEDLNLDWNTIRTTTADTDAGFDTFTTFTFGSISTYSLFRPIREIAATLRVMLIEEAAHQLGVPGADLDAQNSRIYLKADPDQGLNYGEIVAAKSGEWVIPEAPPPLKANRDFQFIGKSMERVDIRDKVTGRAVYGYDARVDGMLYGAVARPPRYGAKLTTATAGEAESMPGVHTVVIRDDFAGVVAESRVQAYAALNKMDLTWEGGTTWSQQDLDEFMAIPDSGGTLVQRVGNLNEAIRNREIIEAEYSIPLATHAHLEPQGVLVDVQGDSATVISSTQAPGTTRDLVAETLGIEPEQVNVIPAYIGGGFGRKVGTFGTAEAAILAQASGKPVHVGWNRLEEMCYAFHRPPARNRLRAVLSEDGHILAMQHTIASGDIFFTGGIPFEPVIAAILGADPLALSMIQYDIPHRQVLYHRKDLPIPTGSWRGLGTMPNTFAVESFMDELAHIAGINPLQFRLNHLPAGSLGTRMRDILLAVTEAADWDGNPIPERALGLAVGTLGETIIALVAEVSAAEPGFRVDRTWCAVDPGLVVNPDGARAQVEGTITMALSSVLHEKLTIEDGMVSASNFNSYPLITIADVPEITVLFVESSDAPIGGLGEAVIGVVPAAVGSAVYALTGQRLRHLPFLPMG